MPSTFRNPPFFSFLTVAAAGLVGVRAVGLSKPFLGKVLSHSGSETLFRDYTPLPEDLIVATYTKSGTNWALQIAIQIAWAGRAEFDHIHTVVPWPEGTFPGVATFEDPAWRAAPHPVHIIKTAIRCGHLPIESDARFLTVLRDPKALLVSSYHFLMGVFGMAGKISPDEWVDWYLSENFPMASWAAHTADIWAVRERDNVMLLHFADMCADLPRTVDAVAQWLEIPLNAEARTRVLERCSFQWMKANEDLFGPPIIPFTGGTGTMMRSGKAGQSHEMLSAKQRKAVDHLCRQRLLDLGCDLPYDALFVRD